LLLHIIDITHPNARAQAEAVYQTLSDIEADHVPVLTVLNKIDRLQDPDRARESIADFPNSTAISALKGSGMSGLLQMVGEQLYEMYTPLTVFLPYKEGGLISNFHEYGQVETTEHVRGGVIMQGRLPGRLLARFKPFTRLDLPNAASEISGQEEFEAEDLEDEIQDWDDEADRAEE
jgi:GTP-binding protein HflX